MLTNWQARAGAWMLMLLVLTAAVKADLAPFPYARMGVANGCFVESVSLGDEVRARFGSAAWYRLLQWGAKEADEVVAGHAVLVFEHAGSLWSFDINHGFSTLKLSPENRDDVAAVAKEVTAPYLAKITPRYPVYREDSPQAPDPSPPAPSDDVVEWAVRDAGLVAVRLAMHRKVKWVEFTYPKNGSQVRGGAVAFVFGGRLCVYSPAYGTVPFRVRALSVDNIRQLQELLRRIHPGATNLTVK